MKNKDADAALAQQNTFLRIITVQLYLTQSFSCKKPDLDADDGQAMTQLPTAARVKTCLYLLLPVVILISCLMVDKISTGIAAFFTKLPDIYPLNAAIAYRVFTQ